jgi:putative molybdopterin biosynthesis protein
VLARTRPLPVRQLAAVVRAGQRRCNRPPASASRWLLDLCLDRERIPPAQVRGYDDVVPGRDEALERLRSGQADMMWGTPDLARRHGWQFLPLTAQTLYLATRTGGVPPAAWQALRRELSGREFAALAQRHPDHDLTGTGQRLRAAEALPWHRGAAVHMQVHADDDDCASPAQSGAFPPGAPRS